VTSALERIKRQIARLRSRSFMEAAMATGALVAWADRKAKACERSALETLLRSDEALGAADAEEALAVYDAYVVALVDDYAAAKKRVLELATGFAGDETSGQALLDVGMAIGISDRSFVASEYAEIVQLSEVLGLDLDRQGP